MRVGLLISGGGVLLWSLIYGVWTTGPIRVESFVCRIELYRSVGMCLLIFRD